MAASLRHYKNLNYVAHETLIFDKRPNLGAFLNEIAVKANGVFGKNRHL